MKHVVVKRLSLKLFAFVLPALMLVLPGCGSLTGLGSHKPIVASKPKQQPNFIVILLDDLGLHDLGVTGNDFIETPAIDQLARDGVVFTKAYANAPNCAPSRAALISGQYATRTGVYTMMTGEMGDAKKRKVQPPPNRVYLPENIYTLAEMLNDNGYATAHIGKWNLGTGPVRGPAGQGFDVNIGGYRGGPGQAGDAYFAPYATALPGLQIAPKGEYLTDRLNNESVAFIEQNKDKPFFLYLSHFAPHFPIVAPAETREKYRQKREASCGAERKLKFCDMTEQYPDYAAMIEHVDRGVAQIRASLAANNLADNTVIVLASDNGGYAWASDPDALRGAKSQLYEGGVRVPMIWSVPKSVHNGKSVDIPVTLMDIYPTFAAMADINTNRYLLDGVDMSSLFLRGSPSKRLASRPLFWYLPGYTLDSATDEIGENPPSKKSTAFYQTPAAVIQYEGWKLTRYYDGKTPELYYLPADPYETNDLYEQTPVKAAFLMTELEKWLTNTGGVLALPPSASQSAGQ